MRLFAVCAVDHDERRDVAAISFESRRVRWRRRHFFALALHESSSGLFASKALPSWHSTRSESMRHILVALTMLLASQVCSAQPNHPALHKLFADEWERSLRESPENASNQGDTRFNDRWSDMSLASIAASAAADKAALARLRKIDRKALSDTDRLNYDTFEWQLKQAVARRQFREHLSPIGMATGVQSGHGLAQVLSFSTEKDYRDWLARLAALPVLVEQNIVLMQEGIKAGIMPPA
ncbi:MAG: DUF885 family protein, partial [Rhodoferax sp.]|nr:DUF885 family protein [Rhodoferax sp.]